MEFVRKANVAMNFLALTEFLEHRQTVPGKL
jgi:hypothetical protein